MAVDSETKKTLMQKVEEADLALALNTRRQNPEKWAEANADLGDALAALADMDDDASFSISHYHQALEAYDNALKVLTQKKYFSRWGGIMVSSVRTMRNLALKENDSNTIMQLQKCLVMLDEVYQALPEDMGAFDRGIVAFEQGHIYRALSDISFQPDQALHLEKAGLAFADAASIMRQKENFHYWALALSGHALAYSELARQQAPKQAVKTLQLALNSFESVVGFYSKDDRPQDWSFIQFEMGRALMHSAMHVKVAKREKTLGNALTAFRAAQTVVSQAMGINAVVRLQNETAMTLSLLSQHKKPNETIEFLNEAVDLYRDNLTLLNAQEDGIASAIVQGNLGKDLTMLANLVNQTDESLKLRYEAIDALRKAVDGQLKRVRPIDWLSYYVELGAALQAAANLEKNDERVNSFKEAISIYDKALETFTPLRHPDLWIKLHQWRGLARAHLGESIETDEGLTLLKQAELDFRQVMPKIDVKKHPAEYIRIQNNLGHLMFAMARRSDSIEPVTLLESARTSMEAVLSLINAQDNVEEWTAGMAHYAVILWRLASFGGILDCFEKSGQVFKQTLESPIFLNNPMIAARVTSNYALMLSDWALHDKKSVAHQKYQKAITLLEQVLSTFKQHGDEADCHDVEEDLSNIYGLLLKSRRKWYWPF